MGFRHRYRPAGRSSPGWLRSVPHTPKCQSMASTGENSLGARSGRFLKGAVHCLDSSFALVLRAGFSMATVATLTLVCHHGLAVAGTAQAARPANAGAVSNVRRACAPSTNPSVMSCLVLIRTDIKQRSAASFGFAAPTGDGYGPAQLQSAYKLPSSTAGVGESVAVVDAYRRPDRRIRPRRLPRLRGGCRRATPLQVRAA